MSIESRTRLAREASIMQSLDHPLMADLFYFKEDETNSYLVMEYLENSSLLDFINSSIEEYEYEDEDGCTKSVFKIQTLDENIVRKIFVQLIVALEFLHNVQHVAHRDIKAENVLLDRYNNIRIIDFGLSAIVQDDKSLKRTVGSVAYTAPEILSKKPYSKSADIWSAGVLLYALSTSHLPFISHSNSRIISSSRNESNSNLKNNTQTGSDLNFLSRSMNRSSFYDIYNDPKKMCQMILHGNLDIPETLSPDLRDLLYRMLEKDPNKRITIKEIVQHPFFSQEQYNMLTDFIKKQDKVEDIDLELDPEIVSEMESRGLNCELLPQLLFLQELDEVSAAYKEMKKVKVMKDLSKLYDQLQINSSQDDRSFMISDQNKKQMLNGNDDDNNNNNDDDVDNNLVQQISNENKCHSDVSIPPKINNNKTPISNQNESPLGNSTPYFFSRNLHRIVDDNYEDSSENYIENDSESSNNDHQSFRKSQSVVISELNFNFLLNSNESASVQTSPPFNDKKSMHKTHLIPHPASPAQPQQFFVHSQMTRSQTSSLIFTPNENSDGTNSKIVPKSYMRPRIHLGLMNV